MAIEKITAPRQTPFFAETDGTIEKHRLVKVDPATNIASYEEEDANAIVIGEALPEYGNSISYVPTGDMSREYFLTLGGVVTRGDMLTCDAEGKGIKTEIGAEAVAQACASGVAGQVITVRMFVL